MKILKISSTSSRPMAVDRHRGQFITSCMMEGMTLKKAEQEFERANRKLWAQACS